MYRRNFSSDVVTLILYFTLVLLGWMTIYAVSSATGSDVPYDMRYVHGKQILWIGIALVLGLVIIALDYRIFEAFSYIAYGFALLLLVAVLFVGKEVNGAKSWIIIAGQPFQPSEFAKLATALALAKYLSRPQSSLSGFANLMMPLLIIFVPAIIIILQNDTGSALVFASFLLVLFREGLTPVIPVGLILTGIVGVISIWLGNQALIIGVLWAIGAVSFLILYNKRHWRQLLIFHVLILIYLSALSVGASYIVTKLPQHQQDRIMVLFDPQMDPLGKGYNVIQSQIAIGSGGFAGKGYLQGSYTKYKFVPKQETDFIFCAVGEEYGWIGSTLVILIFFMLIWRIMFLAESSKTNFARVYGYSVMSILFFHVLVNVGMTIGLVPVIGIPLPFFSYGGSSLLSFTMLIAVMINFYSNRVGILGSKS